MIETPEIATSAAQIKAYIHLTVPVAEIQQVMDPGLREVHAALAAQGIAPVGPWFTYHRKTPSDVFDFEICVPVASPVTAVGRVQAGEMPARRVARTVYHGPYEGLRDAWCEFMTWIGAQSLTPAPDPWECYLRGPESSPHPADWRTQLNRPLLG
jgi:effector-binding domain-containing protein